jgi:hypothetical protein
MIIALIVRIHDHGLTASQAELVAEMQEWFADRSEGTEMHDSHSIRTDYADMEVATTGTRAAAEVEARACR